MAEHGIEDIAAAGEAEEGVVVLLAGGAFVVVVGAGFGAARRAANAAMNMAFLRCLFPARLGCSPRIEVPDLRVTGASPA